MMALEEKFDIQLDEEGKLHVFCACAHGVHISVLQ
jgi:hypothetical protein